jgi:hypothetical protein
MIAATNNGIILNYSVFSIKKNKEDESWYWYYNHLTQWYWIIVIFDISILSATLNFVSPFISEGLLIIYSYIKWKATVSWRLVNLTKYVKYLDDLTLKKKEKIKINYFIQYMKFNHFFFCLFGNSICYYLSISICPSSYRLSDPILFFSTYLFLLKTSFKELVI